MLASSLSMGKPKHAGIDPPAEVMLPVHSETERVSVSAQRHASALPPKAWEALPVAHGDCPLAGAPLPPSAANVDQGIPTP